jgi:hypothetical protein
MSTSQNNVAALGVKVIEAPCDGAAVINQGDILKVSSNKVVVITAATDTPIGFSDDKNPVAGLGDQLTKVIVNLLRPINTAYLPIKAADTPNFWDALYATADGQILTTSSGGGATQVGRFLGLSQVTGDDSTRHLVGLGL